MAIDATSDGCTPSTTSYREEEEAPLFTIQLSDLTHINFVIIEEILILVLVLVILGR